MLYQLSYASLTRHRQPGKAATSAAKSLMSRGRIEPPAAPDSGSRSWPSKRNRSHASGISPSSQFSSTCKPIPGPPQRPVAAHLNATLVVKEAVDSLVGDACAHARKGPREGQQDCASALPTNEENKGRIGFARQKTCAPTGIEPHPPATGRATRRRLTGHHPCRTGYRQIKSETGFFRKFPSLAEPMRASLRCNAMQRYTMLPDVTEIGKAALVASSEDSRRSLTLRDRKTG